MGMKKQEFSLLAAAILLSTFLAGCGSGEKPKNSSAAQTSAGSTESTSSATLPEEETTADQGGETTASETTGTPGDPPSSRPSAATTTGTPAPGDISFFKLASPLHGERLATLTPTFTWEKAAGAASYTLVIEEYQANGAFQKKMEKAGITGTSYKLESSMKVNTVYRWSVTAVNGGKKMQGYSDNGEGNVFMSKVDPKNHPANKGLNFTFKNTVSEEVLRNYLSRSMIAGLFGTDRTEEDLRMVYYTGAKYIGRAGGSWAPNGSEYDKFPAQKQQIAAAHAVDPELVFEACIFETVFKSVEEIPIPSWVFEAFGQKAEKRNFKYDNMVFEDGTFADRWGANTGVPDMTRVESQMFFYYRACTYIDMGYEGLHMGQVMLMGAHDTGWAGWQKMLNMVRAYAKTHARRGFVFINAHTSGMKGPDGKLLFDFHAYPYRGVAPKGSTAHKPTDDNPQKIELRVNYVDSIYKKSMGGTTYSGWSCDSLPYFVELDNWSGYDPKTVDQPIEGSYAFWGFDEISWFANQPQWYRHEWLNYAYKWVRTTDPAGYAQMPGNRTAALRSATNPDKITQLTYYCNSTMFDIDGFDDENAIRSIWINDRNSR